MPEPGPVTQGREKPGAVLSVVYRRELPNQPVPDSCLLPVAGGRFGRDSHFGPKAQGGDMPTQHVEKRAGHTLALRVANLDKTLGDLCAELAKIGFSISVEGLRRFFKRHGMRRKKTGHDIERERSDILTQRRDRFGGQYDLDPERLVPQPLEHGDSGFLLVDRLLALPSAHQ